MAAQHSGADQQPVVGLAERLQKVLFFDTCHLGDLGDYLVAGHALLAQNNIDLRHDLVHVLERREEDHVVAGPAVETVRDLHNEIVLCQRSVLVRRRDVRVDHDLEILGRERRRQTQKRRVVAVRPDEAVPVVFVRRKRCRKEYDRQPVPDYVVDL